jgi:hypothetical protein
MLRKYIEYRERRLHGRDNNRRQLPFEWGLEHLGIPGADDPASALSRFVADAFATDSFYTCTPVDRYDFDGDILKFSSAVETPYPENNTVWARYFPGDEDLAVIVLPQWNCQWDGQIQLCRMLQRAGIGSLRLSMPYHHRRKPAELERSEYLVSANIGRTLMAARQAVLDTRRSADWLLANGYRRIGLVGTSIGSCIGFLAFVHDRRFATAAFIHVSSFFADVVWNGLSTSHVRSALEKSIDLEQLRYLWSPISPYPFVERLRGDKRKIFALSGKYDLSFPAEMSAQAYREFDRCGVDYEIAWMSCGHYTMGRFPFNAVAGYRIVQFLRHYRSHS